MEEEEKALPGSQVEKAQPEPSDGRGMRESRLSGRGAKPAKPAKTRPKP